MGTEINIIKIEGKFLEKLVDVFSQGLGKVYTPKGVRKEADAEAYKIMVLERAKKLAAAEGREIDQDSHERMQDRLLLQETRRQLNLEKIAQIASSQMSSHPVVSEEPIDQDWITRFFNIVQDVSNEEMQNLWAKILAGEIAQPNSFSIRTLETLRSMNKTEAHCLIKLAKLAIWGDEFAFTLNWKKKVSLREKYNISVDDLLLIVELGIISLEDMHNELSGPEVEYFFLSNYCISVLIDKNLTHLRFDMIRFTKIGTELLKLIDVDTEYEYLKDFISVLSSNGVVVKYAEVSRKGDFDTSNLTFYDWSK